MVYDKAKVIDILMERDEMSYEDALEFYSFNIEGAWAGRGTPIWLDRFEDYKWVFSVDVSTGVRHPPNE